MCSVSQSGARCPRGAFDQVLADAPHLPEVERVRTGGGEGCHDGEDQLGALMKDTNEDQGRTQSRDHSMSTQTPPR